MIDACVWYKVHSPLSLLCYGAAGWWDVKVDFPLRRLACDFVLKIPVVYVVLEGRELEDAARIDGGGHGLWWKRRLYAW